MTSHRLRTGARALAALTAALFFSPPGVSLCLAAQAETPAGPVATATRTHGTILIDGRLDERDWQDAVPLTTFTQRLPAEGQPATQQTSVRILFDDERLLIGAEMLDTQPDRIIAREMKEDSPLHQDDAFAVLLDTFRDRRNGFFFETNPNGARADALVYDEGRTTSFDWDGVWNVASVVSSRGWTAEIEIPFRTLHFHPATTGAWGLQFRRLIRRDAEEAFWAPIPRNEDLWRISRAGELRGLEGIRQGTSLMVKPYGLAAAARQPSVGQRAVDGRAEIGLDARYDLTPNLSAVVTVNTDFAETEVDNQQVNTSRFPLFFPEKREFFLESTGYFNFGFNRSGPGSGPGMIPFFSRRVGLDSATNSPLPIQGGAKLAGRVGRYNLGFLTINADHDGAIPQTNFTVLRASRDVLSRSNWGVIGVSKDPVSGDYDSTGALREQHSNRTFGADLNFSVLENFKFGGSMLTTRTPGDRRGEGSGHAYANWSNDRWAIEGAYRDIARDFNPEAGFVSRTGIEELEGFFAWSWRSRTAKVRQVEPHMRHVYTMDQDHVKATSYQHYAISVDFRDGSDFEVAWNPGFDRLDDPFLLDEGDAGNPSDDILVRPGGYSLNRWSVRGETDSSRVLSGSASVDSGDYFDGDFLKANATLRSRFSKYLRSEVRAGHETIRLPERAIDPADPNSVVLPVSRFDSWLIAGRLGVTFTTRLCFDALLQYNTTEEDFSSNLRFNWKYRPGSDLYAVYTERKDIEGLPTDVTDRVFTVKWTWLAAY